MEITPQEWCCTALNCLETAQEATGPDRDSVRVDAFLEGIASALVGILELLLERNRD